MKFTTSTKEKSTDFEPVHIPESIYVATLKEVKDISDGQYGARVAWIYEVEGKELALVCYKTKATKDNKLGQTLLAHKVAINDQEVETEALIGTKVRAWVEDYEKDFEVDGKVQKRKSSIITKVKSIEEKIDVQPESKVSG
ncbi:MAG TPA: hypothetical protein VMX17_15345 [Candidatus Glassbacteria bacterium]|nr:hypothetical protein [Candidatus Glassbacteria bacterium]